jgi:transcriptional regulator with XRE-family HTH domain
VERSVRYHLRVGQQRRPVGFGEYLRDAIHASGFATPTQFARSVGTDPSVVLRWISEEQRPTIRSIERIAPVLGRTINEMIDAAYPDRLADQVPGPTPHPLASELSRILAEDSPISPAQRQVLATDVEAILAPYRSEANPGEPYRAEPYQAEPYQAEPYQAEPYQAEPYQAEPYQAQPYQAAPYPAEQYQSEAYRPEQCRSDTA